MPHFIAKLGTKYVEWSTIVDAPVTEGFSRDELRDYLLHRFGEQGVSNFKERMERVERTGTSLKDGTTARDAVSFNRAGPRVGCMSFEQLVEWAGGAR